MAKMIKIAVATGNRHKYNEIKSMLPDNIELVLPPAEALLNEETGMTYNENALQKARYCAKITGLPSMADDSGIEIEALDNRPGIYSARYAPTDKERIEKLLLELGNNTNRNARYVCSVALSYPDGDEYIFEGICEGTIEYKPSGQNGFGYDPIFRSSTNGQVMAELTESEKNAISHRGIAVRKMADFLEQV